MSNFMQFLLSFAGRVSVPKSVLDRNEKILLHISDTPSDFFRSLKMLINEISPEYIVHTGDFVDDVKLGLRPYKLWLYEKKSIRLLEILEGSGADEIHITLGNHDDEDVLRRHSSKCKISKARSVSIENTSFNIGHYSDDSFEGPASFHLFGHDLGMRSSFEKDCWHLNGISAINIIFLESGNVLALPYPLGTDDSRQKKNQLGF